MAQESVPWEGEYVMPDQSASLFDTLVNKVTDVAGDVARAWAAGEFGYQTWETGPGGVVKSGKVAPVKTVSASGASLQLSTGVIVLGVAALIGLYLAFK